TTLAAARAPSASTRMNAFVRVPCSAIAARLASSCSEAVGIEAARVGSEGDLRRLWVLGCVLDGSLMTGADWNSLPRHRSTAMQRRSVMTIAVLAFTLVRGSYAQTQAPSDYGPVSVDLTDMPYPHPVSTLSFVLYGQDVRMAYM